MEPLALWRPDQVDLVREAAQLKALATVGKRYRELLSATLSQEDRLKTYGYVREEHGYDTTDPWLCDDSSEHLDNLRLGSLVCITGTELVCTYLGPSTQRAGFARLRDLRNLKVVCLPMNSIQPLPSRAPSPGEKAVFVGLDPDLDGWPCSCGPRGEPWGKGGLRAEVHGRWFWAVYTEPGMENVFSNKTMKLVHETNLQALQGPSPGAKTMALDPESAPRALLEPLAATAQEEKALLFARGVVRDMIAEASEEPGVEAEALTDLVDSMRSAARERNSELERTKGAPGQPNSNVVAMLSLGNAEDAEEDLRLQRAQQKRDQVFLRNRARKQPLQQQSPPRLQEARQPDKDLSSCIYEPQVEEQPESPPAAEPSPTPLLDTGRADECPLAEDMQPSVCAAELNEENLQLKPRVPLEALEPSLPSLQYLMELSQDSLLTTSATEASQHDPEEMAAPQDSHPDAGASMGQSVSPKAGLPKMASDAKMKKQAKKFRHTPTPQRRLKHKTKQSAVLWYPRSQELSLRTVRVQRCGLASTEVRLQWTFPQTRYRRLRKHIRDPEGLADDSLRRQVRSKHESA